MDCLDVKISVVNQWLIALLLELEYGVVGELLPVGLAVGLCPGYLPGIMLSLEMSMALRSAEFEHFAIIPHKRYAVSRVDWT